MLDLERFVGIRPVHADSSARSTVVTRLASGPWSALASVPVVVEVVGLSVWRGGLRWRVARAGLPGLSGPDGLARELAGVAGGADPGVVLHSTSWRHTGSELIVTYALFPDLRAAGGGQPLGQHLVTGPGPLRPSPPAVGDRHVAAHAVRHLADLAAGRDPHVVGCARRRPGEWKLLAEHASRVHVHPDAAPPAALPADPPPVDPAPAADAGAESRTGVTAC